MMFDFTVTGDSRIQVTIQCNPICDGVCIADIAMKAQQTIVPEEVIVSWNTDVIDCQSRWHPGAIFLRNLVPSWDKPVEFSSATLAPVHCLIGSHEKNRITIALSDAMNVTQFQSGVCSVAKKQKWNVHFFAKPTAPLSEYHVQLRIDTRDIPYYDSLKDVTQWWETFYAPVPVPDHARLPMYSTWYSFHQRISDAEIEKQCRLAKEIGCETVIVDDGWQTEDNSQGYGFCGDWKVCENKMHDMAEHVRRVHDIGMKYMLWFTVPYIGYFSENADRFRPMRLTDRADSDDANAYILDPRYSQMRKFLIDRYAQAVEEWGLDGFKLDFVDEFKQKKADEEFPDCGRDTQSVPEAVDKLMTGIMQNLRAQNPDVLVEFRQAYIGPLMRKYGNMFRVNDCPNDVLRNRVGVIDIRLLCGSSAAHSDMLMWDVKEPVETAALQLLNVFYSVPQVSMLLDTLPRDHIQMLKFYLNVWKEYRDILLDGQLIPHEPALMYPAITAKGDSTQFSTVYSNYLIDVDPTMDEVVVCNATANTNIILAFRSNANYQLEVYDCLGRLQHTSALEIASGVCGIAMPKSGLAKLKKLK